MSEVVSRPARALFVAATGTLLAMTAFTAPLSIVPSVAADLQASVSATSWILSSMSFGLGVALLTAGALGDEIGRRRVFVAGAALLGIGSVACGAAVDAGVFIAGRIVEGVGGAAVIACALAVLSHAFPAGPGRVRALGIWGSCMGAGPAVGPLLGASLDVASTWRLAYLVITVLTLTLAALSWWWLDESRSGRDRGVDVVGSGLLAVGLGCLLAALTECRQGWVRLPVVALAIAALIALAAFIVHQLKSDKAMLELGLFRRPALISATCAAFVTGAGVIALMSFISTVLERASGRSPVQTSVLLLAWSGTSVAASLAARHVPKTLGGGTRLVIALTLLAAGLAPLSVLAVKTSVWQLITGMVVAGVATGLVNATLAGEAVASVPVGQAGLGSGINNTSRYVGAAVGVTVVSTLATQPAADARAALMAGWNHAALIGAVLTAVTALVVLSLQRAKNRWQQHAPAVAGGHSPVRVASDAVE